MSNLVAWPVLLPLTAGITMLLLPRQVRWQRAISFVAAVGLHAVGVALLVSVQRDGVQVVQAGGWAAPYGITLAADLYSVMMVLLAGLTQFSVLLFAFRDMDKGREKTFFYPVLQFLVTGINLSFVTGDMFNLFVAFEVMLISSYFLLVLGGAPGQLREGFKYLVINAGASTLFLVALALLYGVMGSVNMADVAMKAAAIAGHPMLTVIGLMFMLVFATKAALFPLYFWLPRSYFEAQPAIAAMFAAMLTKVGVYALVRVVTLIFHHAGSHIFPVILAVAGLTMLLGVFGAISQMDFKSILSYHIISQIGYMIMGLGLFSRLALAGTVFYMAHHIVVKSALFLVAGVTNRLTGTTNLNRFSGLLTTNPLLGLVFFMAGISLAGIPPFSGFFAKFALIRAGVELESWGIVAVSIGVSLLTLFSMVKVWRLGFWGEVTGDRRHVSRLEFGQLVAPVALLVFISTAMGFGAGQMMDFSLAAADQLLNPASYIEAVLGR